MYATVSLSLSSSATLSLVWMWMCSWFQGESDSSSTGAAAYNCTFPAMIDAWRQEWHINTDGETARYFPFGFVSLGAVGCTYSVQRIYGID